MPFATCLAKRGKPRLASFYFCAEHEDDCFIASTNFPSGQFLGSINNVCSQILQQVLSSHPQQMFLIVGAWPLISCGLLTQVWNTVQIALSHGQKLMWTLGGFSASDAQRFHRRFKQGTIFGLNSVHASTVSCKSWWCASFQPFWPRQVLCFEHYMLPRILHAPPSSFLTSGWRFVTDSHGYSLAWADVADVQVQCIRTAQCRKLLAQEVEQLFGYDEAHTAPLLQEGAPGDPKDRGSVEARRLRALLRAWPVCFIEILLHSAAETECGPPASGDLVLPSVPDPQLACPYLSDRRERGLVCNQVGPDWADMHAFQAARPAGGLQHKSEGFAVTQHRLIPFGLPPTLHALMSEALQSPLQLPVPLADDLDFAVRTVVQQGHSIRSWRQCQWRRLCSLFEQSQVLQEHFESKRSASSRRTSAHLCPASLEAARVSIAWPDDGAALALCEGVQIVGELPSFGIDRSTYLGSSASTSCFCPKANQLWLEEVLRRRPPRPEETKVVWEKSETERSLGILEGWFSPEDLHQRFGLYQWRPMMRFATWQENHQAYRCIDNAKSSEHNLCTGVEERIHTTSVDMGLAICQRFRALFNCSLEHDFSLQASTKDMKRAYRQVPVSQQQLRFSVIAVWHPLQGRWVFGILHGLAFGLLSAVLQFNRYPALLVAIARRWLAIPVINFFDDFKITEPRCAKGSGAFYFDKLIEKLGWLFDPEKDKPFKSTAVFLGGMELYFPDSVKLQPLPEREELIRQTLAQAIATSKLSPKEARRLSGKLTHFASFYFGRIGRGQTHAIVEHGLGSTEQVSNNLLLCLQFHLALIDLQPYRHVSLVPDQMPRRTIYTDASCEPRPPFVRPVVQVSWIVLDAACNVKLGGFTVVPDAVLRSFAERHTYIAQGEAFGPLLAVHFHSDILTCEHLIFFIDNLGTLSAMITGRARIADFGAVVHAFHLSVARLRSTSWFEHVESPANPADGGSRVGAACPIARQLGIQLHEHSFPHWPENVMDADPATWLSYLFPS